MHEAAILSFFGIIVLYIYWLINSNTNSKCVLLRKKVIVTEIVNKSTNFSTHKLFQTFMAKGTLKCLSLRILGWDTKSKLTFTAVLHIIIVGRFVELSNSFCTLCANSIYREAVFVLILLKSWRNVEYHWILFFDPIVANWNVHFPDFRWEKWSENNFGLTIEKHVIFDI